MWVCLIGDSVGKFTKEEFDEAKKKFDAKEKPYVFYVYFKEFEPNELKKVRKSPGWAKKMELQKHINGELKQVAGTFKNKDALIGKIKRELVGDIKIVKQIKGIPE